MNGNDIRAARRCLNLPADPELKGRPHVAILPYEAGNVGKRTE